MTYDAIEQAKQIANLLDGGKAEKAAGLFRSDLKQHPESAHQLISQTRANEKHGVGADIYLKNDNGSAGAVLPDVEIGISQPGKQNIPIANIDAFSIYVYDAPKVLPRRHGKHKPETQGGI